MTRAIVIGGGIVGLTAGLAMRNAGFEALVCEQHPEIRGTGASLMLWANALGILDRYRVFDEIKQNSDPLNQALYYDPTGMLLSPEEYAPILNGYGYPPLIIHRAKLNQILAAHLGTDHIVVNAKFVGYTEGPDGVDVRFDDGSVVRADLVIGADGVHSKVRGTLVPEARVTEDEGHVAWRAIIPPADIPLGTEAFVIGHRRTRGGWLRTGNGLLFWSVAQFVTGDTGTGTTRKDEVLVRIDALDEGGWNFPLRRLVEATPESKILRDAILVVPSLPRWASARVALAGDSAHAMSPHVVSGASLGVDDVLHLEYFLGRESSVCAALAAYDAERRAHYSQVHERARRVAEAESPVIYSDMLAEFLHWMITTSTATRNQM